MKTTIFTIIITLFLIIFIGCKQNTTPFAVINGDTASFTGDSLLLDGSGSNDADNDSLIYKWLVTSRPTDAGKVLRITEPASCLFVPDAGGSYSVRLVVNDGTIDSDPVSINIKVADFYGKWVLVSRMPPIPTPAETFDTIVYNEEGTFEYYSRYKYQGKSGLSFIGKGKQKTPASRMEFTKYTIAVPPTMEIKTFTQDNDPYNIIKQVNSQTVSGEIIYLLSDGGNILTIKTDGNNDGDFNDTQGKFSVESDLIQIYKRIE